MKQSVNAIIDAFSAAWPSGRKSYRTAKDDSWKSYALAFRNLIESQDAATIRHRLDDDNRQVRALCARVLGFIPSEDSVPALARTLGGDTWPTARLLAADSLGMINSDGSKQALMTSLGDRQKADVELHIEISLSRSSSLEETALDEALSIAEDKLDIARVGEEAPSVVLSDGYGTNVPLHSRQKRRAVALYFLYGDG